MLKEDGGISRNNGKEYMVKERAKKLIFSCVLFTALSIILTCKMFSGGGDYDGSGGYTDDSGSSNVYYSPDGKSVTLYLNGNAPPSRGGRALSLPLAKSSVDYFEVVFYSLDGGGRVDRAAWVANQSASIDVYRTSGGIDYSGTSVSSVVGMGTGAALLFAGKRSDKSLLPAIDKKSLLAVGKICKVDDVDTGGGPAMITTDTQSVTFELAAIKAGTINRDNGHGTPPDPRTPNNFSSFLTNAVDPGDIIEQDGTSTIVVPSYPIAVKDFPLYRFQTPSWPSSGTIVKGQYEFSIDTSNPSIQFSNYQGGIVVAAAGIVFYPIRPKYSQGSVDVITSLISFDQTTDVEMMNNKISGATFQNPVEFEFEIKNDPIGGGRVFAFTFEIPVHNLTATGTDTWYLMPASYENREYLDDGKGGTGGAVLVGVGEHEDYFGFQFKVLTPPNKKLFNNTVGWNFDITGIRLVFLRRDGSPVNDNVSPIPPNVRYDMIGYANNPLTPGTAITGNPTGTRTIRVTYDIGGTEYYDDFIILCANVPNVNPDLSNVTLRKVDDETHLSALLGGGTLTGTTVWLITRNIDISLGPTVNRWMDGSPGATLFIMAANDDVQLTRSEPSANPVINFGSGELTIYIGRWPFSNYAIIDGQMLPTSSFVFDPGSTGFFFGGTATNKTVIVSPDMAIWNVDRLSNAYNPALDNRVPGQPYPQ